MLDLVSSGVVSCAHIWLAKCLDRYVGIVRIGTSHIAIPKYIQLTERLRDQLLSGQHGLEKPILPETELASKYGVARNTVRQAMNELVRDGLIHRIPGKGTFLNPENPRLADNKTDAFASVVLVAPTDAREYRHGFTMGMEGFSTEVNHGLMICNSSNSIDK